MSEKRLKMLWGNKAAWCIILIAVALAASYIRPLRLEEGGEITFLSMMLVCLIGYLCGPKTGVAGAFLYAVLKYVLDYCLHVFDASILIPEMWDYLLGLTLLGICGILTAQGWSLRPAFLIAVLLRYIESVWNCIYFYYRPDESPLQNLHYGLVYCGGYIGLELLLSLVILSIPPVKEAIEFLKQVAGSKYTEDYDFF